MSINKFWQRFKEIFKSSHEFLILALLMAAPVSAYFIQRNPSNSRLALAFIAGLTMGGLIIGSWLAKHQSPQNAVPKLPDSYLARSKRLTLSDVSRGLAWGLVTHEYGAAIHGNDKAYTRELYYGRLPGAAEIALVDLEVQTNEFNQPIIKIKALTHLWSTVPNQVGWINLNDTSFVELYNPETKSLDLKLAEPLDAEDQPELEPVEPTTALLQRHSATLATASQSLDILRQVVTEADHPHQLMALDLLYSIAQTTTQRFGHCADWVWCLDCLSTFGPHSFEIGDETLTFYGCRLCRQTQHYILFDGPVIALLDSELTVNQYEEDDMLYINWLKYRRLFDFDAVSIVGATDEDVERFAVQVGNDTDPTRLGRYAQMNCFISPHCRLSENTKRILREMFGQIEEETAKVMVFHQPTASYQENN